MMINLLGIYDKQDNFTILKSLLPATFPELKIHIAQGIKKGIETALVMVPEIIILDLDIPDTESIEVCKTIKADTKLQHISILLLIADNNIKTLRIDALESGADIIMTKPLETDELTAQLAAIMRIIQANGLNKPETDRFEHLIDEKTKTLQFEQSERKRIEENLQQILNKFEASKTASLNLLEDLRSEINVRKKTENSLREKEIMLSEAQRIARLGSWTWDRKTHSFTWTDQLYQMLKWPTTKKIPDFLNPTGIFTNESLKRFNSCNDKLLNTKTAYKDDFEVIREDGRHIWLRGHGEAILSDSGQITGIHGTFLDITDRKLIEQSLAKSEKRYRTLFENMLNGFAYCRMIYEDKKAVDFVYLLVNKAFEKITGLSGVTGKNVSEVIPGILKDNPDLIETYGRVALTGNPEWFEIYLPALDIWLSISVYCPAKEYFIAIFNPINDQKKNESALRKSETKYRQLFEGMIDAMALHQIILDDKGQGIDYRFLEINSAFTEMTGLKPEDIIGKTVLEAIPDTEKFWIEKYAKVAIEGVAVRFENYSAGLNKYFEVVAYCPEKYYFATIFVDITKQKELSEEEFFRNSVNELFAKFSGKEMFQQVLQFCLKIIGVTVGAFGYLDENGNLNAQAVVPEIYPNFSKVPDDKFILQKEFFSGILGKAISKRETVLNNTGPFSTPKGHHPVTNTLIVPLLFNNQLVGIILLANKTDGFTQRDKKNLEKIASYVVPLLFLRLESDQQEKKRLKAELELRKLSRAVEYSPASIVITDTKGVIEYVNPKFTELTGYSSEEVIGKNPRLLKSKLTPENDYKVLWETISQGGSWRGEFQNKKKNGEIYWEDASLSPIYNEKGEITHYIGVKEDITQSKQDQEKISKLKEFYGKIMDSIDDGIFVTDKNDIIVYCNTKMINFSGMKSDDFEGCKVLNDFNRKELTNFVPFYLQAKKSLQAVQFDTLGNYTSSGKTYYCSGIMVPLRQNDKYSGIICTVHDVTQKKLNENIG